MTFESLFLAGVIVAFIVLGVTLFVVSIWAQAGRPVRPTEVVTPAKRPDANLPDVAA